MSVVADVQEVFACAGHALIEKHEQEHEPASAERVIEKHEQEHEPASAERVIEKHEQEHEPASAEPPHKKQRTRVARHPHSMVLDLGRQTSCAWLEEERRVHELSEVVPGDLRQCARRHCVPIGNWMALAVVVESP